MNPEYLFFCTVHSRTEKVSDSINIALTNIHGQSVTASHSRSNLQSLLKLIWHDHAYLFLRQIPGTPPHLETFMYKVVAMVTLSGANLR